MVNFFRYFQKNRKTKYLIPSAILLILLLLGIFIIKEFFYSKKITITELDNVYSVVPINHDIKNPKLFSSGDINSDGIDEIVIFSDGILYVTTLVQNEFKNLFQLESNHRGKPYFIIIGDVIKNKPNEIIIGWGSSQEAQDAEIIIDIFFYQGTDSEIFSKDKWFKRTIFKVTSSFPRLVYMDIADIDNDYRNELIFAYYPEKLMVASGYFKWKDNKVILYKLPNIKLGITRAVADIDGDGLKEMIIGRPYGELKYSDGDIFYMKDDEKKMLPSTRGVKSLAVGDYNFDGYLEIFIGDGWHYQYGEKAQALLSVIIPSNDQFFYFNLDDLVSQYTINNIYLANLFGDKKLEIITQGNKYIKIFHDLSRDGLLENFLGVKIKNSL
jgi:hypothetical protein